jgi:hypothetical protein
MKTMNLVILGALFASPFVLAQEANPYSGKWDAKLINRQGELRTGTVILTDREGTWDISWVNPRNPCAGKRAPIVIQRTSAEELVFEIQRSKVLQGCKDNVVTMKRVDQTTLKGELDDGRKLTLIKK